jgi:hypothetical protein
MEHFSVFRHFFLRTSHQAAGSRIRHEATDVAEVRGILQGFVANELESPVIPFPKTYHFH